MCILKKATNAKTVIIVALSFSSEEKPHKFQSHHVIRHLLKKIYFYKLADFVHVIKV